MILLLVISLLFQSFFSCINVRMSLFQLLKGTVHPKIRTIQARFHLSYRAIHPSRSVFLKLIQKRESLTNKKKSLTDHLQLKQ